MCDPCVPCIISAGMKLECMQWCMYAVVYVCSGVCLQWCMYAVVYVCSGARSVCVSVYIELHRLPGNHMAYFVSLILFRLNINTAYYVLFWSTIAPGIYI